MNHRFICQVCLLVLVSCISAACSKAVQTESSALPVQNAQPTAEPAAVLHVIGVYQGALPESADKRPWWVQCKAAKRAAGDNAPIKPHECNEFLNQARGNRSVTVNVSDDSSPIVLGLMSYEPVTWKIEVAPGVRIRKVILAGYHQQRVDGLVGTQIDVYTHKRSECERCVQKGDYFYSYKKVPAEMEVAAGLKAQSFQGNYTGGRYAVFKDMH